MGGLVVGNHPVEVEDDRPQSWTRHGRAGVRALISS
jgi:hypothetical protein